MLALPPAEATTAGLASLYPFPAGDGLGTDGVVVGVDLHAGRVVSFDPFSSYGGALTSPAVLVLGRVGRGKSSLLKCLLRRMLLSRPALRAYVLDPKGEYGRLAAAVGLAHVRLGEERRTTPEASACSETCPGTCRSETCSENRSENRSETQWESGLRPLAPAPGESGAALARRRRRTLVALAGAGLGRPLETEERAALGEIALGLPPRAGLADVARALTEPDDALARALATDRDALRSALRPLALELRRMTLGEVAGLGEGAVALGELAAGELAAGEPATEEREHGVQADGTPRGLVLDLSGLGRLSGGALGVVMVAATSVLEAALEADGPAVLVLDEAWAFLQEVEVARFLRETARLARARGTSLLLVTHRLGDLAAGAAGSETERLTSGLLADCEVRVVFGQPIDEARETARLLGLSAGVAGELTTLARGEALWQVGPRVALVRHVVAESEADLVDTDQAMRADPGGGGSGERTGR